MHIPDGFLSTPVWLSLDLAALPAAVLLSRRTERDSGDWSVPRMGVMGAFVFAAQMINFPVGAGTSAHLVGGGLLACLFGPAAAAMIMGAILAIQCLLFQDGGVLALGANFWNLGVLGIFAGYVPFRLLRNTRFQGVGVFAAAAVSVLVAGTCAIAQLLLSGVHLPQAAIFTSFGLFVVNALVEGVVTLFTYTAIARMHPVTDEQHVSTRWLAVWAGGAALLLAGIGALYASADPDTLEALAEQAGISARAWNLFATPLADYEAAFLAGESARKAVAGLCGVSAIFLACIALGRWMTRQRSA